MRHAYVLMLLETRGLLADLDILPGDLEYFASLPGGARGFDLGWRWCPHRCATPLECALENIASLGSCGGGARSHWMRRRGWARVASREHAC